jgi:hypothetical protein
MWVLAGSCRDDLHKRSVAEVVELYNGSRQKVRAKIFKPEQGGAKLSARKSRTLLKALLH